MCNGHLWEILELAQDYGAVLDAVQKKLNQASDTIETARVRSRAVGRKLKDVQELPVSEATVFLPLHALEDDGVDGEDNGE